MRKQRRDTIPEAMWRQLEADGLRRDVTDLNGMTEVERAYRMFKEGFSYAEAVDFVIANRDKEA